jgi:pyruvate formate lyase activating enzyme
MTSPSGIVFDLQRGALHDGPGIRTTVFLKGCPLRCAWCHNPESQAFAPETGCSGKTYGREMTVEEVMAIVRRDRPYYDASGGGLTLSGGEPTAQFEFCQALLTAAQAEGLTTCLDTCGQIPWARLDALRPLVNTFLFDYKATGAELHHTLTGVDGTLIFANLRHLLTFGDHVILRCPIVPGLNATPAHDAAIRALQTEFPQLTVERLAYHSWGEAKYADLARPRPVILLPQPSVS